MTEPAMPAYGPNKRRTERVLLRIPIEISGENDAGEPFKEKTCTLVINRDGARVALRAHVRPGSLVNVKNLLSALSARFRIVGPLGRSLGEGPEWGVECLQPLMEFWGISFPEKGAVAQEPELVDALLECTACRSQELAQLTMVQYRTASRESVSRPCAKCGRATPWRFPSGEAGKGTAISTGPSGGEAASLAEREEDRRGAKRLTVKLPVRIRLQDGREEISTTENISKTGLCFASSLGMKPHDLIYVTVGYSPGGTEHEIPGEVMWRKELDDAGRALYCVHLQQS
ncbi:MAG: PilZ domain-containing protein [Acidobacteriia bacterium]|nr:PilZ domain-containing protein [Terriglobia bacterium]